MNASKLSIIAGIAALFLSFHLALKAQQFSPTPADARLQSLQAKRQMASRSTLSTPFRSIGPSVQGGRIVDMAVNPADPTEFYAAYATGGLWHTTNNGLSFKPLMDEADVILMGALAVHWPSRTIWVGTGEANSSRSTYAGTGVYVSRDSGKTWVHSGLAESHHIGAIKLHPTNPQIAWVAVAGHLYSPNRERGIYKTSDGGRSWKQTLFIDDNTSGIDVDINPQNPNELYAAMWYRTRRAWNFEESGSTSGIYKSTDGGESWHLITGAGSGFPQGEGIGRIGLAVYPKNPQVVYALLDNQFRQPDTAKRKPDTLTYQKQDLNTQTIKEFLALNDRRLDTFLQRNRLYPKYTASTLKARVKSGDLKPTALFEYLYDANEALFNTPIIGAEVYRSNDGGATWKKTNTGLLPRLYNTYGYYFGRISVSPANPDKIVIMGVTIELSTDGGKTFQQMDKENVHADHHYCWMNPQRDSHMIIGNDGGINITYDDGANWFKVQNVPVGQFYTVTVDQAKPYHVYGGLQDNGVWRGSSRRMRISDASYDTLQYRHINGGDGMGVQVDWRDNKTVYSGYQFGNYSRSHLDTGGMLRLRPQHELGEEPYRFNWLTPILISRHNQDIFYMASNRFHRSLNKGAALQTLSGDLTHGKKEGDVPFGTATTLSESPLRFGLLYVGTDDGRLHLSYDAGASWVSLDENLPQEVKGLWMSRVLASRYHEGTVFVSFSGYRNDHFNPYIYMSNDYGRTWKNIAANLPLEPVNVVLEDPKKENILYVGTDGGVYVSRNRGVNWEFWQGNMPFSVPVHDLAIQERENELLVATHGRSLYIASLQEIQDAPLPGASANRP